MENTNQIDNIFDVHLDADARASLKKAAFYAKIVAILGFVGIVIGILSFFLTNRANTMAMGGMGGFGALGAFALVAMLIVYAILGAIYFFLLRFANNTPASLDSMNQTGFNQGINALRTYFKIIGIIVIIVLALFALALVFGIIGSMMKL